MHRWRSTLLAIACIGPLLASCAVAIEPDSPQVKRLIDAGLKYLEARTDNNRPRFDDRVGGQCLLALCFFKHNADATHPHVVEAIARCQNVCREPGDKLQLDLYSTGIAIFFLCEVDPAKYASEIETLVQSLVHRQKPGGAWGYPSGAHAATCDTSMTQYALLGLWTAKSHGIAVPEEVCVAACNWLIRTQDPSGGWGYQGVDPGEFRRVAQSDVRRSLTAAGLGSSYISADLLGMRGAAKPERKIEGLPPAFERVVPKEEAKADLDLKNFQPKRLRQAHADGNRWLTLNFKYEGPWLHYYMYGLERCMSFRELVEGKSLADGWYDRGVEHLAKSQEADGHWQSQAGPLVDTAFAILFLMRGTKKTIQATVGNESLNGVLLGGRGLPKDTASVRVVGGRIVGTSLATSVDELLEVLENPEHDAFDTTLEFPPNLAIDAADVGERAKQIERLARLAKSESPEVRKLAVATLAASGRLEVAPALIAALEDQDNRVTIAARDGLLRVSRKFNVFGPTDNATRAEKTIAAGHWRSWYESVAP